MKKNVFYYHLALQHINYELVEELLRESALYFPLLHSKKNCLFFSFFFKNILRNIEVRPHGRRRGEGIKKKKKVVVLFFSDKLWKQAVLTDTVCQTDGKDVTALWDSLAFSAAWYVFSAVHQVSRGISVKWMLTNVAQRLATTVPFAKILLIATSATAGQVSHSDTPPISRFTWKWVDRSTWFSFSRKRPCDGKPFLAKQDG